MKQRGSFTCLLLAISALITSSSQADEPVQLRILSYNIRHGQGLDREINLPRIAKVIQSANPDLVALQEVDQNVNRSGKVDQAAELGKLTGMKSLFGGNIPLQGGAYGNAILSRLPLLKHKNHPLPKLYEGEQRGVLEAEVFIPQIKQKILFFNTHLDYRPDDQERLKSAQMINNLSAKRKNFAAFLTGDLNALPESHTLREFELHWQNSTAAEPQHTFPADRPDRQIDFVLHAQASRNDLGQWKMQEAKVLGEAVASDHRPILVVYEWSPSTAKPASQK